MIQQHGIRERYRNLSTDNKIILAIQIAQVILMLFRQSNSPLYAYNQYQDLQIYNVVQRAVRNGQVLYRDIFDHKGPALFLVGTIIYYNKFTVWLIDIATCTVQVIFSYKQIRLTQDIWKSLTGAFVILAVYSALLFEQGQPEQIFVSMMFISGYLLLKGNNTHIEWIIHSLFVQFIFYSKINIAIFWLPMFIYLLYKQILGKRLVKNLLSAVVCFFIAQSLILSYFIYHRALNDFIYSYFTLNIGYSVHGDRVIQIIISAVYFLIIAVLIIYTMLNKHKAQYIIYLIQLAAIVFGQFTLSSHIFPYYILCTMPILIFVFIGKQRLRKLQQILLQTACSLLAIYSSIEYARQNIAFLGQRQSDIRWQFYQDVKDEIDSGTFYGVQTIYDIQTNLAEYLPYNNVKYPIYCNMSYDCNPNMYEYTMDAIESKQIEYIAISTHKDGYIIQGQLILGDRQDIMNKIINSLTDNYELRFTYDRPNSEVQLQVFKAKE